MPLSLRGLRRAAPLPLVLFLARPALAAAPDDARARADAEFEEGKALMDAGQTGAACLKFAHSQELDPKLGRLLNLAFCHEAEGKTASAWREYNDAAALAQQKGQSDRVDFAREHAASVAKRLAFLHLVLPSGTESVDVDGAGLRRDQWATPLPVDPGEHAVVASAAGRRSPVTKVTIAAAPGVQELVVPPLEAEAAPAPAPAPPAATAEAAAPAPAEGGARPSRVPALVAGGVAAVGLGVGALFGLSAASKKSDADPHCPAKVCDPTGSALIHDARSAATVSTVGFGVAVVGAGVATWLLVAPPGGRKAAARVTPLVTARSAGLGLEGTW